MRELGDFEARFGAAVVRYLEAAPTRIDPMIVARNAAVAAQRPPLVLTFACRRSVLLAAVLLLTMLVVAAIFVGSGRRERDLASEPGTVPSVGLGGWTELVAANDGTIWSQGENGGLTFFDPGSGVTRVLGPWDDAVIARRDRSQRRKPAASGSSMARSEPSSASTRPASSKASRPQAMAAVYGTAQSSWRRAGRVSIAGSALRGPMGPRSSQVPTPLPHS